MSTKSSKPRRKRIKADSWMGCYPSDWRGKIIQESTSHPAKYSSRLIERIYDHLIKEGWVEIGDSVIDPFAGVGLGALHALRLGLNWTGNELEKRWFELAFESYPCYGFTKEDYVRMAHRPGVIQKVRVLREMCPSCEARLIPETKLNKAGKVVLRAIPSADPHIFMGNIPTWNRKYSQIPKWGNAYMFNGDSRMLSEILNAGQTVAMKSPPFGDRVRGGGLGKDGHIRADGSIDNIGDRSYQISPLGNTDGNLENLKISEESFALSLSSPPYADSINSKRSGIDWSLAEKDTPSRRVSPERIAYQERRHDGYHYGGAAGQLGSMSGNEEGFTAAIASPPFRQTSGGTAASGGTIDYGVMKRHSAGNANADAYGGEGGQLANMPEGDFHVSVASPPYARTTITERSQFSSKEYPNKPFGKDLRDSGGAAKGSTPGQMGKFPEGNAENSTVSIRWRFHRHRMETVDSGSRRRLARLSGVSNVENVSPIDAENAGLRTQEYGVTPGNMGNDQGENFWGAARTIVEEVYANLKPGGHAVWVVKDFVRNWEIVPFCDQWRRLCEAVGFETLHEHHAQLSRHRGTSYLLEGGEVKHVKSSKGFFRRLRESKGTPPIDYEVVYCMVKPKDLINV